MATNVKVGAPPVVGGLDRFYAKTMKFYNDLGWIGEFFVFALMCISVWHSMGRYFFKAPVRGMVELSCWINLTAIFILMSHTQSFKQHVTVDILFVKFPKRVQQLMMIVMYIVMIILLAPLTVQAMKRGASLRESGSLSQILLWAWWPMLYIVALGWILLFVVHVAQVLVMIRDYRRGPIKGPIITGVSTDI